MIAILLALAPLAPLAPAPGEESTLVVTELSSPAGDRTLLPDLAAGPGGATVASWCERDGSDGPGARLLLSILEGEAWSEPVTVATGDDWFVNWVDVPRVAALADGTLLASWLQRSGEDTYAYGIRFVVSRDRGATWSEPRWLHDDRSPVEHGFVSFTALDASRFLAVWLDGRNTAGHGHGEGAMALLARTIEVGEETVLLGEEVLVDERVCDCCPTSLLGSAEDGVVCLYRDRSPDEVRDISYAFRGQESWTAPGPVHADGWRIEGCPVNGPCLARGHGRLAAAWFTGAGPGGGSVLVALSGRAGFEAPLDVDDGTPSGRVASCFLDDGSLLVAWLEHAEGRASWRVRRVAFDGDTPVLEPSLVIAEVSSSRSSGVARLVPSGAGALFAWTADGPPSRVATVRITVRN